MWKRMWGTGSSEAQRTHWSRMKRYTDKKSEGQTISKDYQRRNAAKEGGNFRCGMVRPRGGGNGRMFDIQGLGEHGAGGAAD